VSAELRELIYVTVKGGSLSMEETPITGLGGESDEEIALRWRSVILRLSENLIEAASRRNELSPILLGALHNALDQLLLHGQEGDLMALEEWLLVEDGPSALQPAEIPHPTHPWPGPERRAMEERRMGNERRVQPDRRCVA
jgi:hypothetical protein